MLRFLAPILGERPADIVLLFGEVAALVAVDVPLVSGLRLD
jgi:hypothetical protein